MLFAVAGAKEIDEYRGGRETLMWVEGQQVESLRHRVFRKRVHSCTHVCLVVGLSYAWSSVRAELKAARQQAETNGERAKGLEENVSELRRVDV